MKPFEMTEEFHRTFDSRQPAAPTAFSKEDALHRQDLKQKNWLNFYMQLVRIVQKFSQT